MHKHIDKLNKSISFTFYALFLTVPLAMHPNTSELFELNKMWLVYIYCLVLFFLWGTKMLLQRKFEIRRTPFDIFLLLFFASQILSTIFSMDVHTSFWGYYSRFNGGLLSTICYVFLFFAFSTNILTDDKAESLKRASKYLIAIIISGVLVALWGLPSHFGYDPTCLVFRGSLDVTCWTEAFQPKVRMFSTLGQPNWLAAFLMILIPITTAYTMSYAKKISKSNLFSIESLPFIGLLLSTLLFYLDLGWTLSQSGFIGFWIGDAVFVIIFFVLVLRKYSLNLRNTFTDKALIILLALQVGFVLTTFFTRIPIPSLSRYTFNVMMASKNAQPKNTAAPQNENAQPSTPAQPALESSITGSGEIRKIVWKGAIEIWKAYPVFGSGVETYAFAYYKFRPVEHNLTSEWDYLYNKAHNEFLNYLATTGTVGLGTYLLFIFAFLYFAAKYTLNLLKRQETGNPLLPALVGSFIGIQVSNFFGFSVVNVNLMMFLIPLFYWAATKPDAKFFILPASYSEEASYESAGTGRIMVMIGIGAFCIYCLIFLINYWNADIAYGLGYNYNHINAYQEANPYLERAVRMRGGEDLYKNELSVNLAALALLAAQKQDQQATTEYATRAKLLSDEVARNNPHNVVYWKARTRVLFSLAEISASVLPDAINAIDTSSKLAPTDAKIVYNQALIYDQAGRHEEALSLLDKAIKLKPNYRDAYYAKALFLSQNAESEKDKKKSSEFKNQAKEILNFILKNFGSSDQQTKDLLKTL